MSLVDLQGNNVEEENAIQELISVYAEGLALLVSYYRSQFNYG
jgi:hypothetical protein